MTERGGYKVQSPCQQEGEKAESKEVTMVLVLNALYIPISVVSPRHAVGMMMRGVAERVGEEIVATLRSPSTVFEVPSVLRLKYYRDVPRRRIPWTRKGVFRRDGYTCIYCGARPGQKRGGRVLTAEDFTIDHIVPLSRGGESTWKNTACACRWCNRKKGNRLPQEAGMKLLWEPRAPRINYASLTTVPREWSSYIGV